MQVLVTGFEPYGGWTDNPAGEVAAALDGARIGGAGVAGRLLPVRMDGLRERVEVLLDELRPDVVIALGLYPGAATLRVERVGLNVADFAAPDNAGRQMVDEPVQPGGALALAATLPVRDIRRAHLDAGIPSVVSNSAGTYLCNATLYRFLAAAEAAGHGTRCGFIHLPFATAQVADLMRGAVDAASGGAPGSDSIASMSTELMVAGARVAVEVCAGAK